VARSGGEFTTNSEFLASLVGRVTLTAVCISFEGQEFDVGSVDTSIAITSAAL
jgi:hypothetical protein